MSRTLSSIFFRRLSSSTGGRSQASASSVEHGRSVEVAGKWQEKNDINTSPTLARRPFPQASKLIRTAAAQQPAHPALLPRSRSHSGQSTRISSPPPWAAKQQLKSEGDTGRSPTQRRPKSQVSINKTRTARLAKPVPKFLRKETSSGRVTFRRLMAAPIAAVSAVYFATWLGITSYYVSRERELIFKTDVFEMAADGREVRGGTPVDYPFQARGLSFEKIEITCHDHEIEGTDRENFHGANADHIFCRGMGVGCDQDGDQEQPLSARENRGPRGRRKGTETTRKADPNMRESDSPQSDLQKSVAADDATASGKSDSEVMRGIFVRYQNTSTTPTPTIIFFRGRSSCLTYHGQRIAEMVETFQANVLFIDYRGSGASSGGLTTERRWRSDGRSIIDYVEQNAERLGIDRDRLILWGFSMGSILALDVLTARPELQARLQLLVLESPVSEMKRSARDHVPWLSFFPLYFPKTTRNMDNLKAIARLQPHTRVAIVTIDGDRHVPPYHGRLLHEQRPQNTTLITIPGRSHAIFGKNSAIANTDRAVVVDKLKSHLLGGPPTVAETPIPISVSPDLVVRSENQSWVNGFLGIFSSGSKKMEAIGGARVCSTLSERSLEKLNSFGVLFSRLK